MTLLPKTSTGWSRGKVRVQFQCEVEEVDGWVKGEFGVCRLPSGAGSPRLVYLASGHRIWLGPTRTCKRLADALVPYLPEIDALSKGSLSEGSQRVKEIIALVQEAEGVKWERDS